MCWGQSFPKKIIKTYSKHEEKTVFGHLAVYTINKFADLSLLFIVQKT